MSLHINTKIHYPNHKRLHHKPQTLKIVEVPIQSNGIADSIAVEGLFACFLYNAKEPLYAVT